MYSIKQTIFSVGVYIQNIVWEMSTKKIIIWCSNLTECFACLIAKSPTLIIAQAQ